LVCNTPQFLLEATNLLVGPGLLKVFGRVGAVFLLRDIQAVGCCAEPISNFGDTVEPINNLANCPFLEFLGLSLAAHNHFSDCHFPWLRSV
jgi:hypothetical protein